MLGVTSIPPRLLGINLPNADWIRAEHGSKSVTYQATSQKAYNKAAQGNGFYDEFVPDVEMRELIDKYGDLCDDLHTDLHECLGHGGGQLLPGVEILMPSATMATPLGSQTVPLRAPVYSRPKIAGA